jgi:regulator of nonsense transcripts 2
MKNRQDAEREEQQRIKNLVLNYDLHDDEHQNDGTDLLGPIEQPLILKTSYAKGLSTRSRSAQLVSQSRREIRTSRAPSEKAETK